MKKKERNPQPFFDNYAYGRELRIQQKKKKKSIWNYKFFDNLNRENNIIHNLITSKAEDNL